MSEKTNQDRDALDKALARLLRAAKRPSGVPAPGANEPADDEILRYVEGSASREERLRVEEAIAASAFTRDRVETLKEALAESGHVSPMERAARYVFVVAHEALDFLRGATEPVASPVPVPVVRGQVATAPRESFFELVHAFDDLDAHIRIEHVLRRGGPLDVQIRLVVDAEPVGGARVSLLRGSLPVDSVTTDERGAATFTALEAARYRVEVRQNGRLTGSVVLDFVSGE